MTPLLVLEDSVTAQLLQNPEFQTAFPQLKAFIPPASNDPKKCGSCAATRIAQQRALLMDGARSAIAALGPQDKVRLKQIVGAQQVRLSYRAGHRHVKLTF